MRTEKGTYLRALVFLLLRLSLLTLFFLHLALMIQDLVMMENQEYGRWRKSEQEGGDGSELNRDHGAGRQESLWMLVRVYPSRRTFLADFWPPPQRKQSSLSQSLCPNVLAAMHNDVRLAIKPWNYKLIFREIAWNNFNIFCLIIPLQVKLTYE